MISDWRMRRRDWDKHSDDIHLLRTLFGFWGGFAGLVVIMCSPVDFGGCLE